MLIGTSFCPQQARPLSPYLGLWSRWTERPQDQIRKKLTIKITTKCLFQGRSTDSKSLAAFTWQSFASMHRHFSCAENCIQRYLWKEIYIFFKEHFERFSDTTCYSTLQLPYWKKSAGIWITAHWLHPLSVASDCFPHPLISRGYHHMHERFTLNVSSPSLCKVSEIYTCRTFSMSRVVTLFVFSRLHARVSVWGLVHAHGTHGSQQGVTGPLELEFQEAVSCLMWVFGTQVWSSARTLHALNHWANQ